MIGQTPDCMKCRLYNSLDDDKLSCKAFPFGIPDNIIMGEVKHDKPIKGQQGEYVFEGITAK